jgi:glucosyl-3-phosphoglycerate synthase
MAGRSCPSLEDTLEACRAASALGLLDEILVVGSSKAPESSAIAATREIGWVDEETLLPGLGPVRGKGDAMWRSLAAIDSDLILFCDGDLSDFGTHFVTGLLGPLLLDEQTAFVKATYARPFTHENGPIDVAGGGRVTELLARPVLENWFPDAGELRQPLGGEVAARRELFAAIPFMTGYAVEAVMVIDVIERYGLEAIAEVDLGSRSNDHQSLEALGLMAREILLGVGQRLPEPPPGLERLTASLAATGRTVVERPPMAELERLGDEAEQTAL